MMKTFRNQKGRILRLVVGARGRGGKKLLHKAAGERDGVGLAHGISVATLLASMRNAG
jgi:hypothetical protein